MHMGREDFLHLSSFLTEASKSVNLRRLSLVDITEPVLTFGCYNVGSNLDDVLGAGLKLNLPSLISLKLGEMETPLITTMEAPLLAEISLKNPSEDVLEEISTRFPLVDTMELTIYKDFDIFIDALEILPKVVNWALVLSPIVLTSHFGAGFVECPTYPLVRSLTIQWWDFSRTDGAKVFAMFPNIVDLTLENGTSQALECLNVNGTQSPPVCAKLRLVRLQECMVTKPALLAFSKARAPVLMARQSKAASGERQEVTRCLLSTRSCSLPRCHMLADSDGLDLAGLKRIKIKPATLG